MPQLIVDVRRLGLLSVKIEILIQFGIALGTVGAVVVALFGNLRGKIFPPRLKINIHDEEGYSTEGDDPSIYYHLEIRNERRWAPATQVQFYLTRVELFVEDKPTQIWFGELPMRWRYQESFPLTRTIGSPIQCDLCHTTSEDVQIMTLFQSEELPGKWPMKERAALTLQARSVEIDSPQIRIDISWNAQTERLCLDTTTLDNDSHTNAT